jgi:hypothetical protein
MIAVVVRQTQGPAAHVKFVLDHWRRPGVAELLGSLSGGPEDAEKIAAAQTEALREGALRPSKFQVGHVAVGQRAAVTSAFAAALVSGKSRWTREDFNRFAELLQLGETVTLPAGTLKAVTGEALPRARLVIALRCVETERDAALTILRAVDKSELLVEGMRVRQNPSGAAALLAVAVERDVSDDTYQSIISRVYMQINTDAAFSILLDSGALARPMPVSIWIWLAARICASPALGARGLDLLRGELPRRGPQLREDHYAELIRQSRPGASDPVSLLIIERMLASNDKSELQRALSGQASRLEKGAIGRLFEAAGTDKAALAVVTGVVRAHPERAADFESQILALPEESRGPAEALLLTRPDALSRHLPRLVQAMKAAKSLYPVTALTYAQPTDAERTALVLACLEGIETGPAIYLARPAVTARMQFILVSTPFSREISAAPSIKNARRNGEGETMETMTAELPATDGAWGHGVTGPRLQIHTRERRFLVDDPSRVENLLRARGEPIEYVAGRPISSILTVYLDTAAGTWSRGRGTTKFRCKNYGDPSTWWFELKRRVGNVVDKWRRSVTRDELEQVLDGSRRGEALARFVGREPLLPVAVVNYRRMAFEWSALRVTIDRQVSFYAPDGFGPGRSLGTLRCSVVEVKRDGVLPAWLADALKGRQAKGFSKSRRALAALRPAVAVGA